MLENISNTFFFPKKEISCQMVALFILLMMSLFSYQIVVFLFSGFRGISVFWCYFMSVIPPPAAISFY